MKKYLLIPIVALALTACGEDNKLTSGQVKDMSYDDPDSWTSTQCASYNKDGMCNFYTTTYHEDPAHYRLEISGVHEDKSRKEWHGVTETEYNSCTVGDHWEQGKGCTEG